MDDDLIKLTREGHNLLITGFPGTGKTTAINSIVESLIIDCKNVRVTASTGNAAVVLKQKLTSELNVTTVHRLLGLMDGRFSNDELLQRVLNTESLEKTKKCILTLDVLIIDEISLISAKLFTEIEFLLRNVRQISRPFGGVQVIISGDFYQLPPVPSPEYGDDGLMAFMSPAMEYFHHVNLEKIHRQDEPDLVAAIQDIVRGKISVETRQLVTRLSGSLPPASEGQATMKLFATNFDSDVYNARCLSNMPGEDIIYHSRDEGDVDSMTLRGMKELHLKKGCPVILTVNLSDELVNGLKGVVMETFNDNVRVYFASLNRTEVIHMYIFTKYSVILKKDIGSRTQIPLKLAFSLTAHKAQGMTLDRVIVDCRNMNRYGQLVVALSRARKKRGLRIHNFSTKLVVEPPASLSHFYSKPKLAPKKDLLCCCCATVFAIKYESSTLCKSVESIAYDSEENIGDDVEHDLLEAVETIEKATTAAEVKYPIPEDVDVEKIVDHLKYDHEETDQQKLENKAVEYLKEHLNDTRDFVQYLWDEVSDIKKMHIKPDQKFDNKKSTEFYRHYNMLVCSERYKIKVLHLFGQNPSLGQFNVVYKLSSEVRNHLIQMETKDIRQDLEQKAQMKKGKEYTESAGGRGKIRYIAGWCIATMKRRRKKSIYNNMYNSKKKALVEKLIAEKDVLENFESAAGEEFEDSESISEICRKQNARKGLAVVNDKCFEFFLLLDRVIRQLQSFENLTLHRSTLSTFLKTKLKDHVELGKAWETLVSISSTQSSQSSLESDILNEVIDKYSTMSVKQLRKEYLDEQHVKKKEATRKQIRMRSESSKKECSTLKV